MARFRIRNDARAWFSQIADFAEFKNDFDLYYMCVIVGFASGKSSTEAGPSADLVDHFVEQYKPASLFLVGLLVVAELKKAGREMEEEGAVRSVFTRLVDPRSPDHLTDEGMRRMNAYASGGYEYLAEKRETKPYSGEKFLRDRVELLAEAT